MKKALCSRLFLFFIVMMLAGQAYASGFTQDADAIEEAAKSVLKLLFYDEKNDEYYTTGSGFIAFDSSTLITNYHVIEGATVGFASDDNDKIYEIEYILCADKGADIVILGLSTPSQLKPLELYPDDQLKRGSAVLAIGSPEGLKNTVSTGIISSVFVNDKGIPEIQTTAPISHGSSGGALFNDDGKVIGVTTSSISSGQNLNFAINIAVAQAMYNAWNGKKQTLMNHFTKAKMDFSGVYLHDNQTSSAEHERTGSEQSDKAATEKTDKQPDSALLSIINGTEIRADDADLRYWVNYTLYQLEQDGYDTSSEELTASVHQYAMKMAQNAIICRNKSKELGLDSFTKDEIAEMETMAVAAWDEIVTGRMDSLITNQTDNQSMEAARELALSQLKEEGYTEDMYIQEYLEAIKYNEIINRLNERYPDLNEKLDQWRAEADIYYTEEGLSWKIVDE